MVKKSYSTIMYCLYGVLTLSCLFVLFCNLGNVSVENWDEARHGVNAYEMIKNNNFIINTYNYYPDLWNLKPPLSFWAEALSFLTFGYNLFAFRLPSAIAMFLTFVSISIFLHKNYNFICTISFMVLFQSFFDMILEHCGRNGDADALFLLFFSLSMIFIFYAEKKKAFLYLSGLTFSLAFLSKSFHSANILGIIVMFVIFTGLIKKLKIFDYLMFFISAFVPILIWAIIRYCYDGWNFLGIMFGVDVVDRAVSTNSNDIGRLFSLLKYITSYRTTIIILSIIIISLIYMLISKKIDIHIIKRKDFILMFLWFFIPFCIYNASKSTMSWYYYPLFVCLIVVASILIGKLFIFIKSEYNISRTKKVLSIITSVLVISLVGYLSTIAVFSYVRNDVLKPSISDDQTAIIELSGNRTKYSDINAYIYKDTSSYKSDTSEWEQADTLVAELYGDWICKNGGVSEFAKSKDKAILLISNSHYKENIKTLEKYKIADKNNNYLLIANY